MKTFFITALMVLTITFAIRASNNMLAITLPLVAKYIFYFSPFLVGLLSSLMMFFSFVSSVFINSKLTSKKRELALKISSIIYAITFLGFYFVNPLLIWVLSAVSGLSMGIIFPNIVNFTTSVDDEKSKERLLALYTTALSLSLIISPFMESLLLHRFTLTETFLFFSMIAVLVPIISFKIRFMNSIKRTIRKADIIRTPGFLASLFNNMMYDVPFGMIVTFGGIYATTVFHTPYSLTVLIYTAFYLTSFVGRALFTVMAPKRIFHIIYLNAMLTVLGLVAVSYSPNFTFYTISLLILGIPHGLTYPSSLIILTRSFREPEERNVAISYFSGVGLSGGIPILMGFIIEEIGLRSTFALLSLLSFSIFLLFLKWSRSIRENIT